MYGAFKNFFLSLFVVILFSCGKSTHEKEEEPGGNPDRGKSGISITHAKKFTVDIIDGHTVVTVLSPWPGSAINYHYLLIPRGGPVPDITSLKQNPVDILQIVRVPVEEIVCTSTSHIPLLDLLGETTALTGFPGTDYISSEKARALIRQGKVKDLGSESTLNIEKLLALTPQVLMDYPTGKGHNYRSLVRNAGIPVLLNADYLEETPLGRAEWIKFAGLFFDKTARADSIFSAIASRYDSLKSLTTAVQNRPTVYSGIMYGDTWFLPGGENSGAIFLKDAGGNYLWSDTKTEGSLKLSLEAVYEKAYDADFWVGVASFGSLEEIRAADSRYTSFKAFKEERVYSYNAKMGAKGGSTFLELGYARPDIILADLIKILHPELLPDYDLYFYKKLE